MNKNDIFEVEIVSMTNEGNGVAKIDGFAVFVPNTAVGDTANIKIIKVLKNYAIARLENIITPSLQRIENNCDCFLRCGGCNLRHISYDAELEIKKTFVKDCFERLGKIDAKCNDIIASKNIDSYRNKAQFPVGKDSDGNIVFGFYANHSHRIIPLTECCLQPDVFTEIANDIVDFVKKNKITVYDSQTGKGTLRHIYIRKAETTNQIMVCLVATKSKIFNMDKLVQVLTNKYSNIASVVVNVNSKNTNVILGNECVTVWGEDYIVDRLCDVEVQISPLSFYQVNHDQAQALYNKAIEYANLEQSHTLIDMYCGIGTIGLACANRVEKMIGVEIIDQAIQNAKINAQLNNINNAEFICDDAKGAATSLVASGIRPNVIIVDPPRKGCETEVIESIVKLSPERVVMVSCNPATAARDCSLLEENGFKVVEYTPVDMFPRTVHVETIIMMTKCGSDDKK